MHKIYCQLKKINICYFYGLSHPNFSIYIHKDGDGIGDNHHQFGYDNICWGSGNNAKCGTGDGYGTDFLINCCYDIEFKNNLYFDWVID